MERDGRMDGVCLQKGEREREKYAVVKHRLKQFIH